MLPATGSTMIQAISSAYLAKMAFTDIRNDRKFNMSFENYEQLGEQQNFSYFRNLNVSGEDTNEIDLDIKLFAKPCQYLRVDVVTPVVQIEFTLRRGGRRADEKRYANRVA